MRLPFFAERMTLLAKNTPRLVAVSVRKWKRVGDS
jgi:hypothetical protein